jgi:hypothetical protein
MWTHRAGRGRGVSQCGVPVIDPMPTTLRMAEAMVKANLRHSRRSYHVPPPKVGYDFVKL